MIKTTTYSINNLPLTNKILEQFINKFWEEIFNSLKGTHHLLILCKVQFTESEQGYKTLGHLRKCNFNDKELFLDYLIQRLGILSDSYITNSISSITFSYLIKDGLCPESNRLLFDDLNAKVNTSHNFNNMVLPISMNPTDYGIISGVSKMQEGGVFFERYHIINGPRVYKLDQFEMSNVVTILGNIDLTWTDTKIGVDIFKREIKKSTIYFMDGETILRKKELPAKPFRRLQKESILSNKFITLDMETITKDNKITPYLINAYNGRHHITSFNSNENELFNEFIPKLITLIEKGKETFIYAHNLSSFDGVLLLKQIFKYGKVKPLIHHGKIISIKLIVNIEGVKSTIIFKDSFLLLSKSLRELCVAFNVESSKGYFPFNLENINYSGVFPKYENWTDITLKEWNDLKNGYGQRMWNFQLEATKYCKLDCVTLHQILTRFNELIYGKFNININSVLTIASLAMKIYKTHFMPANTIYQLGGRLEFDIRKSYSGGAVDVFIPHNRTTPFFGTYKPMHRLLYSYDVNNLYPTVMAYNQIPVGKPIVFEGNIRKVEPDAIGFFYCKITSTKYLEHPILQRRIKTDNGMRSIAGLGSWEGWIFSGEMVNAMKFGYEFEILRGYQFEPGNNIFTDYVETLFNLRTNYPKTNPLNYIGKLLLNSLYGKFGMRNEITDVKVFDCSNPVNQDAFNQTFTLWAESIKDHLTINNYQILVRNKLHSYKYNDDDETYHGMDTNIAIASAITAYARVHMSEFKNNPLFKLYYTDTDNIVVDKPLPEKYIGKNLGQMKLENIIKRAVFLAPKVYGLVTVDGNVIIKIKGVLPFFIFDTRVGQGVQTIKDER